MGNSRDRQPITKIRGSDRSDRRWQAMAGVTKSALEKAWPADNVERRAVASLIPYARNSRTHSDAQVDQIAASIKEWGWTVPVLIEPDGGIIAGHGRIMAAQKLGIAEVPCMVADGWSDAQKRAYIIADNKLALNAGWDDDFLKIEMQELDGLGFSLELTGFDVAEMAALFDEPAEPEEPKDLSEQAERFEVIIECSDEGEQERAYNHAQVGGFECRISTF